MSSWSSNLDSQSYRPSSPVSDSVYTHKRAYNEAESKSNPKSASQSRPSKRSAFWSATNSFKALADSGAIADDVTSQEYVARLISLVDDPDDDVDESESGSTTSSAGRAQVKEVPSIHDHLYLSGPEMGEVKDEAQSVESQSFPENFREQALQDQYLAMENEALRYQVEKLRDSQSKLQKTIDEQKHLLSHVVSVLDPGQEKLSEINKLRKELKRTMGNLEMCRRRIGTQANELEDLRKKFQTQSAELEKGHRALAYHNTLRRTLGLALQDIENHPVEQLLEDLEPLTQQVRTDGQM
ncbi:hypothetical protein EV360DRAFT_84319 [Lentinula raphanica]|nr:hypothetical protein EV360DRAFT_84319 [Lentinula raphanica]